MDPYIDTLAQAVADTASGPRDQQIDDPYERYLWQIRELERQGEIREWCRDILRDDDILLDRATLKVIEHLVITAMLQQHQHTTAAALNVVRRFPAAWPVLHVLQDNEKGQGEGR